MDRELWVLLTWREEALHQGQDPCLHLEGDPGLRNSVEYHTSARGRQNNNVHNI